MRNRREAVPYQSRRGFGRIAQSALLLGLALGFGGPAMGRELRWRLQAGREYRVFVERTVRQKSLAADWLENVRYQMAWVVTAVDERGQMQIVQKLVEVKHSIQLADAEVVMYDSTQDAEARGDATNLARNWKPLLQIERAFILLPNGKTERVEALPKENSTSTPPAPNPATTSAPAASTGAASTTVPGTPLLAGAAMSNGTARPTATKLLQEGLWTLPSDDVEPGAIWEETVVLPWGEDGEALRLTSDYSYEGEQTIEQIVFDHINVKLTFEVQPRTDGNERLIMERQAGGGFVDFDADAGYMVRSEMTQELVLQLLPRIPAVGTSATPPAFSNPTAAPTRAELSTSVKVRFQPVEIPSEVPTVEP